MSESVRRELTIPQPPARVWQALTQSAALAEWMFPNDFLPSVGHQFTFQVPANPKVNFEGMTVRCQVLECEAPGGGAGGRLVFSWAAGGLPDMRVSFRLEPDGEGTRLFFEQTGFDISQPWGKQALRGAEYGWANMLGKLPAVVSGLAAERT